MPAPHAARDRQVAHPQQIAESRGPDFAIASRMPDQKTRRRRARSEHPMASAPSPRASARSAGLRYVDDRRPGIRRIRCGRGFRYRGADGRPVEDAATLARIRALAIPPAYREVWICNDPRGHLQATGRDARGRKQYRYHRRWRKVRDETKFERMPAFASALPAIRRAIDREFSRPGLPRAKVVAAVVRLLESTCIRVGNDEYARDNGSYGLTTLLDDHVAIRGTRLQLEFVGKSGKPHSCTLSDARITRIVARCRALPGELLFQYLAPDGRRRALDSGEVNRWLRRVSGGDFSAKDFRTWSGTLLAAEALSAAPAPRGVGRRRRRILRALDAVAQRLNNSRAVCRSFYVHPTLLSRYEAGELERSFARARRIAKRGPRGLSAAERRLLAFLESIG